MTLSFFVEKQKITRTDTETPAANSNCYLKAKFEFGNDWDVSSSVCPIFRRGGEDSGYMPQLKDGRFLDEQNICFVPIEVLNKEGRFFVSIFDYKSGKTITTNEAMVEVCRSGPVFNSPTIYSLDLRFENENLQLTANGEAVGAGVELPKQEIDDAMSDTSENPVQNKVAKAYTDEKTKATPTDITLTDNLLQLTANGKAVGDGVKMQQTVVDDKLSDTSENPVENKAVANEVFAVKGLLNVLPAAVSGTAVRVDDVYAAPHDVAVTLSGDITDYSSVKVRRTGKNLIPFPYPSLGGAGSAVTKNGVTVTVQEDGGVRMQGTATVTTYFNLTNSIRYSKKNLNNIPNEFATDNFVAISGGNMYYTYANTTLAIVAEKDKTYDATIYPQVEIGNRPTVFECGIPLEYFTPNADGTVEGVKSISPTMSVTTDTDGLTVSVTYQKVKQFKRIHTIVNCPAFTNQPTVDGDLHTEFKPWNETYYYVHILDSAAGTFQLMALKDDTSSVIEQTFTLSDLNTGNSGILKENSPVDFISVGTGWQMRSAGVEKISFYGMNAAEMSIKASGFANVSGYLFIGPINGFMGNDFKYSGSVTSTIYNGDAGFLFSASAVKSKNVLISLNATFKVGQKMMNVNGNCSYQAMDDTDFFVYKGNKTTLPIAGICARKDLNDFEKNKIKEFYFRIASGFIFRNGFEIEVKGRE